MSIDGSDKLALEEPPALPGAGIAPGYTEYSINGPRSVARSLRQRRRSDAPSRGHPARRGVPRGDNLIHDDLCSRLHHRADIDPHDIEVEVRDGLVILEGSVPDPQMKYRIEDVAEVCPGVRDVDNRLRVQQR
jgi:osmotically-inducible protein OsmY